MKELATPELYMFRGYLKALGSSMIAPNYRAFYRVKGYDLTDSPFNPESILKAAYPESAIDPHGFRVISPRRMIIKITRRLKTPKAKAEHYDETVPRVIRGIERDRHWVQVPLAKGYWELLKACVDYGRAQIFSYSPPPELWMRDELGAGVWWHFTYIIYNSQQRRCVILRGGASD